jgi:hypothetical protein
MKKSNNYYWIIILILLGLSFYFIFKPIIEPIDKTELVEVKNKLIDLTQIVDNALNSSTPDLSTPSQQVESDLNNNQVGSSPPSQNVEGNYTFTFSLNNTNLSNTLTLTIDESNTVTSAIMPMNQNVYNDDPNYNTVVTPGVNIYDSSIGSNDNKLKVSNKNEYIFGQSGKGGLALTVLGNDIDKNIINAMYGKYSNLSKKARGVNNYFFTTDVNGKQILNVYDKFGYVEIPQSVYTLTITKL